MNSESTAASGDGIPEHDTDFVQLADLLGRSNRGDAGPRKAGTEM